MAHIGALPILAILTIIVLFTGAGLYTTIERPGEIRANQQYQQLLARVRSVLTEAQVDQLVTLASQFRGVTGESHDWDFFGSLFFCLTAITTIGYGTCESFGLLMGILVKRGSTISWCIFVLPLRHHSVSL